MMFFADLVDIGSSLESSEGIFGTILKAARSLFFNLNELIYKFVAQLYNIFDGLCHARLLDSSELQDLSTRVGYLLGVIMLFMVILDFIRMVLDPDKMNDKQMGAVAIIKKCILVIAMLGMSTFFFDTLYYIQNYIINHQIIYKILLPANDVEINTKNFGNVLAARTFGSFYTVNQGVLNLEMEQGIQCENYRNLLLNEIVANSDYTTGSFCLNAYGDAVGVQSDEEGTAFQVFIMDYNFLLQTITGVILVYILVSYVLQVGVRIIQLTVLQIISPMAIIGYLSPKQDNLFTKWWKIYFATYIDVFIRIAIIYFIVYISASLLDQFDSGSSTFLHSLNDPTGATRTIFLIVMILSLLMFAKKAPELIKDLFPAGASKLSLGLKSPKEMLKDMDFKPVTSTLKLASAPIGLLAKKTVGGVDSLIHGHGFHDGFSRTKGKFATWVNKQREQYTPYAYQEHKKKIESRIEGEREVKEISEKWNSGVQVARKLMRVTKKKYGTDGKFSQTDPTAWNKVLNGEAANKDYYNAIFKHEEFINSKMAVDYESDIEDHLRRLQQKVNLEGAASAFAGGPIHINGLNGGLGKDYDATNIDELIKDLETQTKRVEGLKGIHQSISKQYQEDAKIEEQIKFIKNHDANPASPGLTRTNPKIGIE